MEHETKTPFVVTSILIGAVTYAIVFNLDNIASHLWKIYEPFRTKMLQRMEAEKKEPVVRGDKEASDQEDEEATGQKEEAVNQGNKETKPNDRGWVKRAKAFHTFGPKRDRTKPLRVVDCAVSHSVHQF